MSKQFISLLAISFHWKNNYGHRDSFIYVEWYIEMPLNFVPSLLNSASVWATTSEEIQALYDCPYTGAVSTRTCLVNGFNHEPEIHQHCFTSNHNISDCHTQTKDSFHIASPVRATSQVTSLNTYGYSPWPLAYYLDLISSIIRHKQQLGQDTAKAIIISITGTPREVAFAREQILKCQGRLRKGTSGCAKENVRLLMEINLSCPNISGKPPPAYSKTQLLECLIALSESKTQNSDLPHGHRTTEEAEDSIMIGIKTPPYTYQTQFDELITALSEHTRYQQCCPISFITATNTLGSSLFLTPSPTATSCYQPTISSPSGTGIGGLAGAAIHPLALGNVATLRRMLDLHEHLKHIEIIGVGGVSDGAGFERMKSVGAAAVGVATALGLEGVDIFGEILGGKLSAK